MKRHDGYMKVFALVPFLAALGIAAIDLYPPSRPFAMPVFVYTPGQATHDTATFCRSPLPPREVTLAMRRQVFANYHIGYWRHAAYELDHLVPRELGGDDDVRNLWPQPYPEAYAKDSAENYWHGEVCGGRAPVLATQVMFMQDWRVAYLRMKSARFVTGRSRSGH